MAGLSGLLMTGVFVAGLLAAGAGAAGAGLRGACAAAFLGGDLEAAGFGAGVLDFFLVAII
jgi:hypothetical protein